MFIILIAIALFGALGFAVTRSGSGTATMSREQADLAATRILDYATAVQNGVENIMITNHVPVYKVAFNNNTNKKYDGSSPNGTIPSSPANPNLYLFLRQGGGVKEVLFEDATNGGSCGGCNTNSVKAGHPYFRWVNNMGTGTADMAMLILYLTDDVCRAINRKLGITGIPAASQTWDVAVTSAPSTLSLPTGAGAAQITGRRAYCYNSTYSGYTGNWFTYIVKVY